ncbi:MAG TPA: glycosyltransferase 87 family protein [Streptosporangiaceae bacterium]|nr:glycosyltransferase 87 family protein [Streptosporangiaceae bacterium]
MARRLPLLTAAAAWLAALAAVGLLVHLSIASPQHSRLLDLNVYRAGGQTMLHGGALYAMQARQHLLFTYPPVSAILAVPLALVSWPAAQLLWIPVIYVPLAVSVRYGFAPLLARAGHYAPAFFAALFALCAYLLPVRQEMRYGQVDILLVALCVLDCAAPRARWPRGALIGLATAIKLVPGVFLVYLLITGRRRAAGVAVATFAGLTGLAWLIAPRDSADYWTSAIFNAHRLGPNAQAANQALRGMVLRMFVPHPAPVALWLGVAALVAAGGFLAARQAFRRGQEMAGIAITGLLAALLSPVAWIHHFCWVVLALGVIIGDGRSWRRAGIAVAAGELFASTLPVWAKYLLLQRAIGPLAGRTLEDTFGLAAIALIGIVAWIGTRPPPAVAGLVPWPRPAVQAATPSAAVEDQVLAGSRD